MSGLFSDRLVDVNSQNKLFFVNKNLQNLTQLASFVQDFLHCAFYDENEWNGRTEPQENRLEAKAIIRIFF